MSRSSVLLVLFVASLAAAGLRSDGAWWGEIHQTLGSESRADIGSLKEDIRLMRIQAQLVPLAVETLWDDARREVRTLEADVVADARHAARRISTLIKTG